MRIVYFGNGWVGYEVLRYLKSQGEEIAGVVLNAAERQVLADKIVDVSRVAPEHVFLGTDLREPTTIESIGALGADLGFSAMFSHILRPEMLEAFPRGVLNIHPGYLPYNRGRAAQVWSIIDKTPVGATLHYMDAGVDSGPIIHQQEVSIAVSDTGATLREKLLSACVDVVREAWPNVTAGKERPVAQETEGGSTHRLKDLESIEWIDLNREYKAGDLIDLLRALTSPPQSRGAYFEKDGKRVRIALHLEEESS